MSYAIAIDGPSGAGKSTIAKRVAKELSFIYVDTGAMYRAMALYVLEQNIDPQDQAKVAAACPDIDVTILYEDGVQQVLLNGKNVSTEIRQEIVGNTASRISVIKEVREKLVALQRQLAEKENVEIKQYSVIYQAIEDVEAAMKGMLDPVYEEKVIGNAIVRQTFKVSGVGTIAGAFVTDGKIERNAGVRVIRENVVIHDGKLISLKRFKDDVKEVSKGFECGLQIEGYNDVKEDDNLEFYIMEEVKR